MRFFFVIIIVSILLSGSVPAKYILNTKPYKFDPGKYQKGNDIILLSKEKMYTAESGFGWVKQPDREFERKKLSRSRDEFIIDGVTGKQISFRADIPEGKWFIMIWIEAGFEDSSTITINLNDQLQEIKWQAFSPPDEPRISIQNIFRVYSGSFDIKQQPFEMSIKSELDSVRLLGFTLIPGKEKLSDQEQTLLSELKNAGKYKSDGDIKNIQNKFLAVLDVNPEDPFAYYWNEQINLFNKATTFYEMMGWEWAKDKTGLGIFDRYFQSVMILDALVNDKNSLLYEKALWLRSKILYWLDLERGEEHEKAASSKGLKELYNVYPDDPVLAMYNGEKIDQKDKCDALKIFKTAPLWSKLQYEALCRLKDEIDWWVNFRQEPNGELGGKLGDDVEILRGWTPAILSGDKTALAGWIKLAECVWGSPMLYKGYSKEADDVEHASEFISDTTPELVFFTDEIKYIERLKFSADYFESLWTGINNNGERHFKSAWFSSTEVDSTPPKNRDLEMNARAVKAVRYYAWKTADRNIINHLHEWSIAWVKSSLKKDKEKPGGIIPASVRFPDGQINGNGKNWYDADMYWNYFDWHHNAGTKMYDQFLFTYLLTGDSTLLQPIALTLQLIKKYEKQISVSGHNIKRGSEEWAVQVLKKKKQFWNTVEQYRFITSDKNYDDLILKYGTPYSKYRLTGDISPIEKSLHSYLENIRFNTPLRTSEVLHTDRVYYPGTNDIKAMLTGDGTDEGSSPYYSVSWENTDEHFTALVNDSGTRKIGIQIFSHADNNKEITMRVWQLKPGKYSLQILNDAGVIDQTQIEITKRGERINLSIPPQQLLKISINQK